MSKCLISSPCSDVACLPGSTSHPFPLCLFLFPFLPLMRSSLSSDPLVQSKPLSPYTLLISLSSQTPQGAITLAYPANKATLTPQEIRGRQAVQMGDSLDFSTPYLTLIIPERPEERPLLSHDPVNASGHTHVSFLHVNGVSAHEKAKSPIPIRRCCQVFAKTRVTWPLSQLAPSGLV